MDQQTKFATILESVGMQSCEEREANAKIKIESFNKLKRSICEKLQVVCQNLREVKQLVRANLKIE